MKENSTQLHVATCILEGIQAINNHFKYEEIEIVINKHQLLNVLIIK